MKHKKSWHFHHRLAFSVIVGIILFVVSIAASLTQAGFIIKREYHAHADFKVFLGGEEVVFSSSKYNERDPYVHLHTDNDFGGDVLHVEGKKSTLGEFFSSLDMSFSRTCFVFDKEYCDIKFYVNGEPNDQYENYVPHDLDRILISDGGDIQSQLNSVTRAACIFSNKCEIPPGVNVVTF